MDKVPAIGGARGLFEIFVPGVFLLLNLVGTVYFLPFNALVERFPLEEPRITESRHRQMVLDGVC